MAYELKYQSDFYNYFQKLVSVKIYKNDYEDSEVTELRTSEVIIEANYKDDNTPVIGTGAKVVIITEDEDLDLLEDLLISYEKQFICTIEYDGVIAFRGYSLCDLNERELLPYTSITLQFTDYLHRLSEHYPSNIKNPAKSVSVMRLVSDLMDLTGLDLPLLINSTLFETQMETDTSGGSFLPQVFVQNFQFHTGPGQYDTMYDVINKALQPFSAFIFYYKDQWIIERQEDITRDGNWIKYDENTITSESSFKLEVNKQDDDFKYVGASQMIEYDSGLKTLILELRDKKLDSLIFNDYTMSMSPLSYFEETLSDFPTDLDYRTWYRQSNAVIENIGIETTFKHMTNWVHWTADIYMGGLAYTFRVNLASSEDIPTTMTISYKVYPSTVWRDLNRVWIRFMLRLRGGPFDGYWVVSSEYDDGPVIRVIDPTSVTTAHYAANTAVIDATAREDSWMEWIITKEYDLSNTEVWIQYLGMAGVLASYDNFYQMLGMDSSGAGRAEQYFDLIILPPGYSNKSGGGNPEDISTDFLAETYLGDVSVVVTPEDIDNKIEYYLN